LLTPPPSPNKIPGYAAGTDSGSCLAAGFDISGAELSGSATQS